MTPARPPSPQGRSFLFFLLLAVLFMAPCIFQGKTFHGTSNLGDFPAWYDGVTHAKNYDLLDGVAQFYSTEALFHDEIRRGHWPLWNPYSGLGQPLYQGTGSYYFYPLTPILHLLLPTYQVHDCLVFIHLVLAGFFMAWFLSLQGRSPMACRLGGVAWAFGGIVTTYLEFVPAVINFAWFPAYLGCIYCALSSRRWLVAAWLAGGVGVCSGFLNVAWICLAVGGLFALYLLLMRAQRPSRNDLGMAATVVIVPLLLAAAQTWPTLQVIAQSYRVLIPPELQVERMAKYLIQLPLELLVPDYWGNPAGGFHLNRIHPGQWFYFETCFYIGAVPALLALYGCWKTQGEAKFFRNLMLLQLLVLATPLWRLASLLSFVSKVNSIRTLFMLSFCLCVLAAAGMDSLLARRRMLPLGLSAAFLAAATGLFLNFTVLTQSYLLRWLASQQIRIPFEKSAATAEQWQRMVVEAADQFYRWSNPSFYSPILVLMALALLLTVPFPRRWLGGGLLILSCLELLPFGARFNVADSPELLERSSPVLDYLTTHNGPHRVLGLGTFRPNTLIPFKIHELTSYWSFLPRDSTLALSCLMDQQEGEPRDILIQTFPMKNSSSRLLDLFSVKYLVPYPGETVSKPGAILRDDRQLPVYENVDAQPIVWMVPQVELNDLGTLDLSAEIDRLRSYDFKTMARVFGPPCMVEPEKSRSQPTIQEWSPGYLRAATPGASGWLIFGEGDYPGWRAWIDGRETPIYRADAVLMAVPVPAGSKLVEFRFQPQRALVGLWISLAALLLALAVGIRSKR